MPISIAELRQKGFVTRTRWLPPAPGQNDYMNKMGVRRTFFLNCELVNGERPLDYEFDYEDFAPVKSAITTT